MHKNFKTNALDKTASSLTEIKEEFYIKNLATTSKGFHNKVF